MTLRTDICLTDLFECIWNRATRSNNGGAAPAWELAHDNPTNEGNAA